MATQPSILAWEIPWKDEPGRLQSMGSQRVGPDGAHTCSESRARLLSLPRSPPGEVGSLQPPSAFSQDPTVLAAASPHPDLRLPASRTVRSTSLYLEVTQPVVFC